MSVHVNAGFVRHHLLARDNDKIDVFYAYVPANTGKMAYTPKSHPIQNKAG